MELSQKELQRVKVIENAVAGRLSVNEAAELLQLSARQVKRLKQRQEEDAAWAQDGNRGRLPANRLPSAVRQQVIKLARGRYAGFNDSYLDEKLTEVEGLAMSRQSVRRILREARIASPQKRHPAKIPGTAGAPITGRHDAAGRW